MLTAHCSLLTAHCPLSTATAQVICLSGCITLFQLVMCNKRICYHLLGPVQDAGHPSKKVQPHQFVRLFIGSLQSLHSITYLVGIQSHIHHIHHVLAAGQLLLRKYQLPAARHCIDQQKPRSFDFYSSFNPHALLCYNSPVEKGKARSRKCNGSPTVMLLVNDAKSKGREDQGCSISPQLVPNFTPKLQLLVGRYKECKLNSLLLPYSIQLRPLGAVELGDWVQPSTYFPGFHRLSLCFPLLGS